MLRLDSNQRPFGYEPTAPPLRHGAGCPGAWRTAGARRSYLSAIRFPALGGTPPMPSGLTKARRLSDWDSNPEPIG